MARMADLAFMSFEHYPLAPCDINWSALYREPEVDGAHLGCVARGWNSRGRTVDEHGEQLVLGTYGPDAGHFLRAVACGTASALS